MNNKENILKHKYEARHKCARGDDCHAHTSKKRDRRASSASAASAMSRLIARAHSHDRNLLGFVSQHMTPAYIPITYTLSTCGFMVCLNTLK